MSDESVPPSSENDSAPSKSWKSRILGLFNPFWLSIFGGSVLICSLLICFSPGHIIFPNAQEIVALKEQTRVLNERLSSIEASEKVQQQPTDNGEQLATLEQQVAHILQQIESLQTPQASEESSKQVELSKSLVKDLRAISETQEILKSALLFWHLKAKVLSNHPFVEELAAFQAATKETEDLSILEKYKESGLQSLKETAETAAVESHQSSWWGRIKATVRSLIKVEKIDATTLSLPVYTEDRQAIEDLLAHLDRTYVQQLSALTSSQTTQSGDAL